VNAENPIIRGSGISISVSNVEDLFHINLVSRIVKKNMNKDKGS